MNATERMEAKVKIRNLELEGKLTVAYELAQKSAQKCWQALDNLNCQRFEKLAERLHRRLLGYE